MKNDKLLVVHLPGFSGFSAPEWETVIETPLRRAAQNYALTEPAAAWALDEEDFTGLLEAHRDRRAQCAAIAGHFCSILAGKLAQKVGFAHGLLFKEVQFAQERGFETDRIVATMPLSSAIKIFQMSEAKHHRPLNDVMPSDFAPYLGCMAHPEGDPHPLLAFLSIEDWDGMALGTLLEAFAGHRVEKKALRTIESEHAHSAFTGAVDWPRVREAVQTRRYEQASAMSNQSEEATYGGVKP
ncbi:hypothetical protein [Bradyrhizobium arachidis]|uniref:hypothetical protein n=1 Tax=Bradyrhizobium arachidis TaxID=858423 RepID=UPI002161761A|nr:hypothetical protein [Bradyrhizobium arachidis]UVO30322.1 hypothetical protein KUF59_06155 [Bradyrhizobium arachidis]